MWGGGGDKPQEHIHRKCQVIPTRRVGTCLTQDLGEHAANAGVPEQQSEQAAMPCHAEMQALGDAQVLPE